MAKSKGIKEIKDAFNNINPHDRFEEPQPIETPNVGVYKQFSVGEGTNVLKGDRDGFWAGAKTFEAAPWRVDMLGNMFLKSSVGGGYIQIRASDSSIIVHDGTNPRVILGGL